ncbi:alpha/beta fold hydrolase [Mumia zhuanghuii]|uniref:Alpha/beta fold hydrolase n=2 Tax=Mumia TaxID=1546255 RepID=A0ABW1QM66_9ACTN|nr:MULTISPECIES: alpha/beta hydrolase [Mumia]KAA1419740.1 alpha/beta fold hydrolase [Mumia zhuanghuii]
MAVPIVLLPALGETRADWDGVVPALADGREVLAVDLRGHGEAAWEPPYTFAQMRDDVAALLDERGWQQVDLVGHSWGGAVACHVASSYPDRVRRLVLEDVGALRRRTPSTPQRPPGPLLFDWDMVLAVRRQIDSPDPRWRDALARIEAPTLVLAGGPTSHVPDETIDELVSRVPDARRITIPVGHLIHATAPRAWLDAVLPFLAASGHTSSS